MPAGSSGHAPAPQPGAVADADACVEAGAVAAGLDALRVEVSRLAAAVPERADAGVVDGWLASLRRVEGAVAGLRTRLVGCAQSSRAHTEGGYANQPSYLKEALGISGREAARQDKLARDLRLLPATRDALTAGEIGAEQAQAIGRSARGGVLGGPAATEAQLLPVARDTSVEDLSREIRRREQEADRASQEDAERRAYRRRRASLVRRGDGMWDLHGLLPEEQGEALATALDAFRTFDAPGTPIAEGRSPEQRTADALADVVADVLRGGRSPRSGGVLPQLSVVVPVEALDPDSEVLAELAHGGVLSTAAVGRLLCDARVGRLVTRGDSQVLDVGRARRRWSVAQRDALRVRDGGCRGPGCDRPPAWTHAHHIVPWEDDGPTSVANGLLLCSRHHHQVHEGGWTVRLDLDTAQAHFTSPTGRKITTHPHRPAGLRHQPLLESTGEGSAGSQTTCALMVGSLATVRVARPTGPDSARPQDPQDGRGRWVHRSRVMMASMEPNPPRRRAAARRSPGSGTTASGAPRPTSIPNNLVSQRSTVAHRWSGHARARGPPLSTGADDGPQMGQEHRAHRRAVHSEAASAVWGPGCPPVGRHVR